uniref:Uncharacterized protein n=1 Tax=Heterorhabditis bacteriophora TaxID=37862 RepID=A0A1I7W607_HETBA
MPSINNNYIIYVLNKRGIIGINVCAKQAYIYDSGGLSTLNQHNHHQIIELLLIHLFYLCIKLHFYLLKSLKYLKILVFVETYQHWTLTALEAITHFKVGISRI